jgi:hypothetical protein
MSATQPISHKRSPGWQFSLLTLLVAMTCVGLMCVALGSPSELWTGVVFVLAVGSLLVAALSIVYRDGRARAFAVGFVIFGTTYFVVSMGDTPDVAEAHTQLPTTRWGIALYTLLHGEMQQPSAAAWPVYPTPVYSPGLPAPGVPLPPPVASATPVVVATATTSGSTPVPGEATFAAGVAPAPLPTLAPTTFAYVARATPQALVPLGSFLEVVHRVLVIFLGVIGGIVAQILYSTRREGPAVLQGAA